LEGEDGVVKLGEEDVMSLGLPPVVMSQRVVQKWRDVVLLS
jgi:hypothetical protein